MNDQTKKEECKLQLEELGVTCKKLPITITIAMVDGITEVKGKTYETSIRDRIGQGVQIVAKGKNKSCLISYNAMLNIAEAMGLFDDEE